MLTILSSIPRGNPDWVTHLAWTDSADAKTADPPRGIVRLGLDGHATSYAPEDDGGGRDDLLCAAVAAGLEATIRRVAAAARGTVERLAIIVTGDVDARGALGEPGVPVGFQSLRVEVHLRLAGQDRDATSRTIHAADRLCVALQTLRGCVPVDLVVADDDPPSGWSTTWSGIF